MADLQKIRTQFHKLMKRPSMSELDGIVSRDNRRQEKVLEQQVDHMDKIARVQLNDHYKRRKSFVESQMAKLVSQPGRRSLDITDDLTTDSFQKLSVLNPQSRRGSLPVFRPWHSSTHRTHVTDRKRRFSMQQHSGSRSIWDELSVSRSTNRSVAIRNKLYDEFDVGKKSAMRRRPWSPANNTEQNKPLAKTVRRSSEPIVKLSDHLSPEIEARLARILGYEVNTDDKDTLEAVSNANTVHQEMYYTLDLDSSGRNHENISSTNEPSIEPKSIMKNQKSRRYSEINRPQLKLHTPPNRRHSDTASTVKLPPIQDKKQEKYNQMPSRKSLLSTLGQND